ncbi:tetratricopeptide repeat protein [Lewinella sp. 4G2]|uniref:tetratricopeptide repeat protein n=1 Tax=Lewinella sp. 4G2 TaxID=1803372 RepID=UPI0007B4E0C4|nr:tetratricopeptide repeat protein [Lewinella sp. 4G2]OAV45972.1 hypothetical protein A3850_018935 [Lewinella sp. 4G2]
MSIEYKVIIAGQLEFGKESVFKQVHDQYVHRMEHFYKDDIMLKAEGHFIEEENSFVVPRTVKIGSKRQWLNTLNLLQRVVEFSIAGSLNMWVLNAGKMEAHHLLEPKAERTTVQIFNKGRELIEQNDQQAEAIKMMDKVLKRFANHAQAYERRGFTNLSLNNIDDALYDYNKSLKINPRMPEAHYGRGIVHVRKQQWAEAAEDFEAVTKNSIPYQPIYWQAQVGLGDAYTKLGRPNDALRVFNMFFKRKQRIATLERYDRRVSFEFAKLLTDANRLDEAYKAFAHALVAPEDAKAPEVARIHHEYGKALEKGGHKEKAAEQFKLAGKDFSPAVEQPKAVALAI